MNLAWDPATGVNLPFTAANRGAAAVARDGRRSMIPRNARSELQSLQTAFTKRLSNRWQASATYTLSWLRSAENQPFSGLSIVPFPVQPDLGNEWTLAGDDQRHRAVFNGIWQVGRGFQVSGLHYFGAGIRAGNGIGGDLRLLGATGSARLRPDGTLVERNSYIQPAQNRTNVAAPTARSARQPFRHRSDRGNVQPLQPGEFPDPFRRAAPTTGSRHRASPAPARFDSG